MSDEELARSYILHELSNKDRDECERRFLFDAEFEMLVLELETDLCDDFVNHRLNNSEENAFRRIVAQNPRQASRLRIAQGLRAVTAEASMSSRKRSLIEMLFGTRLQWGSLLIGTTGVLAIVFLLVFNPLSHSVRNHAGPSPGMQPSATASASSANIEPHPPQTTLSVVAPSPNSLSNRTSDAALTVPHTPTLQASAVFVLIANQRRGEPDTPVLRLTSRVQTIRLQLTTEEGLEAGQYAATLSTAEGNRVLVLAHLPTHRQAGRRYVLLPLTAATLADGDYSLDLVEEAVPGPTLALSYRFTLAKGGQ